MIYKASRSLVAVLLLITALFPSSGLMAQTNTAVNKASIKSSVIHTETGAQAQAELSNPFADIESWTYPNGLQVFFKPMPNSKIVTYRMTLPTGARQDPEGKAGLAHFVEHMLFTGSNGRKKAEFENLVDERGGENNASTDLATTDYWLELPATESAFGIQWFEELMFNHQFDPELVEEERRAIILERDLKPKTPADYLTEWVISPQWSQQPSDWESVLGLPKERHTTIGNWEEVNAISTEDLQAFYEQHYGPQNMTLTLVGNFNPKQLKDSLDQRFAQQQPFGETSARVINTQAEHRYQKTYEFQERGGHAHTISQFVANIRQQDFMWLVLLKSILAEELNRELRQEKQAAYSVSVGLNVDQGQARLSIAGNFDAQQEARSLLYIEQLLSQLKNNTLSTEKFDSLRRRVIASYKLDHQSPWKISAWVKNAFHNREIFSANYPDIIEFFEQASSTELAQWMQQNINKELRVDKTYRPAGLWDLGETAILTLTMIFTFGLFRRYLIKPINLNAPLYSRKILYGPTTSLVASFIAISLFFLASHLLNMLLSSIRNHFISGIDLYAISFLWSNVCAGVFAVFIMLLPSRVPRKVLLQENSWRIKHISFHSKLMNYQDIVSISETRCFNALLKWRGWPCWVLHWNPFSKGIYIELKRGSYFIKSRDNKALMAEFDRHMTPSLTAVSPSQKPDSLIMPTTLPESQAEAETARASNG